MGWCLEWQKKERRSLKKMRFDEEDSLFRKFAIVFVKDVVKLNFYPPFL
jgi:hypothetical protein